MKIDKLDCIGYVAAQLIEKAENYVAVKKKNSRTKWAAMAACLCLVVVGAITIISKNNPGQGEGLATGGGYAGGVSIACFPAGKSLNDVANASGKFITEEEAKAVNGLCNYLPSEVPSNYHFGYASLFKTTMKDGTVYRKLYVAYRTGEKPIITSDGGIADDPGTMGDEFYITIYDFKPNTREVIYNSEEINEELLSDNHDGIIYIKYGDFYFSIEGPILLTPSEAIDVINHIGR